MEKLLLLAWIGGFVPWSVAIVLYMGLRRERKASEHLNCACCGYRTSAEICQECGASEATRTKQREIDGAGQDFVAVGSSVLSMVVAFSALMWFDPSAMWFGIVCISPIALLIGALLWLQRSAVSFRHLMLTSMCVVTLFGVLYFFLLRGVQGGTDPIGLGSAYMFAPVIIAPILGYGFAPSIIVLLFRREPSEH